MLIDKGLCSYRGHKPALCWINPYLFQVRQKFHFKNRIEMKRYLKGKGHDGLEEFFFRYFPHKPSGEDI